MLSCDLYSIIDELLITYAVGVCCFFQAEDGIRDLVRSRGLGDVYKRQAYTASSGYTKRSPLSFD